MQSVDSIGPLNLRTTPSIIADLVRRQIVGGAFETGERISEPQLAQRLGVSRGPVREALQRLVQEGILLNIPNRGVCVVDLGREDMVDIYAARCAIEKEAATKLFRTKNVRQIGQLKSIVAKMQSAVQKGNLKKIIECDLEFHSALVAAAGSPRLNRMFSTLRAETYLCLRNLVGFYQDLGDLTAEHAQLVVLIEGDDHPALVRAMEEHFDSALSSMFDKS